MAIDLYIVGKHRNRSSGCWLPWRQSLRKFAATATDLEVVGNHCSSGNHDILVSMAIENLSTGDILLLSCYSLLMDLVVHLCVLFVLQHFCWRPSLPSWRSWMIREKFLFSS